MSVIEKLKKISNKINTKIEPIALFFIFFLGISISATIAKIFSKNLLNKKINSPTWEKSLQNSNHNKMY